MTVLDWELLPSPFREALARVAVILLHTLAPDELPEQVARLALLAEPELLAAMPPRDEWLP